MGLLSSSDLKRLQTYNIYGVTIVKFLQISKIIMKKKSLNLALKNMYMYQRAKCLYGSQYLVKDFVKTGVHFYQFSII